MKAHWPDGLLPAGHTIKNGPGIYPARFLWGLAIQALKVWLVERLKADAANNQLNGDAASGAH